MRNKGLILTLATLLLIGLIIPGSAGEPEPLYGGFGYNTTHIELEGSVVDFQAYADTTIVSLFIYDVDIETDNKTFILTFNDGTTHSGYVNNTVTIPYVTSNTIFYFDGSTINAVNAIPFSFLARNENGYAWLSIAASLPGFKNITMEKGGAIKAMPYDIDLLYNGIKRVQISSSTGMTFRSRIYWMDQEQRDTAAEIQGNLWNPEQNIVTRLNSLISYVGETISFILAILDLVFIKGVFVLFFVLIELGFTAYSANNSKDVFIFMKRWINFNIKFFKFLIDMLVAAVTIVIGILNTINPLKWLIP